VNAAGTVDLSIPAVTNPGAYTVTVDEGGTEIATSTFTVDQTENIVITSPSDGAALTAPASPNLQVAWTTVRAPSDAYSVSLIGNGSVQATCSYLGSAVEGTTTSCAAGPLGVGTFQVRVHNDTTASVVATTSFTVAEAPRVQVTSTTIAPSTFLPYERDGVRDHATGRFTLSIPANTFVKVRNHLGRIVRHRALGSLGAGDHKWKWTGKNDNGRLVRPGRFTITFSARAGGYKDAGRPRAVTTQLGLHLTKSSVAPADFYPLKRDGYRDATSFGFSTSRRSNDRLEVKNGSGRVIRHINLGYKQGGGHHAL
jgi:hypothetical protein